MTFTKNIFSSLIILLSLKIENSFSYIFIDVSEFDFPSTIQKGVRVSAFDTEEQKFKCIDYYPRKTQTTSRNTTDKKIEYEYYKMSIYSLFLGKNPRLRASRASAACCLTPDMLPFRDQASLGRKGSISSLIIAKPAIPYSITGIISFGLQNIVIRC